MKACEGRVGRVFIARLDEGDDVVGAMERFAFEKGVQAALVFIAGRNSLAGVVVPGSDGRARLRLFPDSGPGAWDDAEIVIQEVADVDFRWVADPVSGRGTVARAAAAKTTVMKKAASVPDEPGPGTVPVYLFNAEFN